MNLQTIKKTHSFLLTLGALALLCTCMSFRPIRETYNSNPVSHDLWDKLLHRHVKADGLVDYKGFIRDSAEFNQYLHALESAHPDDKRWSRQEQMAYWINAYNAYTVKLITLHYPVKSIKDIKHGIAFVNSVWDIKFIQIENQKYDLNNIEHNILRKVFKDPRIHAAINCASISCPKMRTEAFTAAKLDTQLDAAMRDFVNDPVRNRVTPDAPQVSEIFKWFAGDFKAQAGSVKSFLNQYAAKKISKKANLSYLNYDWRLNETN